MLYIYAKWKSQFSFTLHFLVPKLDCLWGIDKIKVIEGQKYSKAFIAQIVIFNTRYKNLNL